jgi:hypothetical protein
MMVFPFARRAGCTFGTRFNMPFGAVFGAPARRHVMMSRELGIQDMKDIFGLQDSRSLECKCEAGEHPYLRV